MVDKVGGVWFVIAIFDYAGPLTLHTKYVANVKSKIWSDHRILIQENISEHMFTRTSRCLNVKILILILCSTLAEAVLL